MFETNSLPLENWKTVEIQANLAMLYSNMVYKQITTQANKIRLILVCECSYSMIKLYSSEVSPQFHMQGRSHQIWSGQVSGMPPRKFWEFRGYKIASEMLYEGQTTDRVLHA